MKRSQSLRFALIVLLITLGLTVVIALCVAAISALKLYKDPFTSFPWWSAFVYTGLAILPTVVIESALCITVGVLYRKALRAEQPDLTGQVKRARRTKQTDQSKRVKRVRRAERIKRAIRIKRAGRTEQPE